MKNNQLLDTLKSINEASKRIIKNMTIATIVMESIIIITIIFGFIYSFILN